MYYMDPHEGRLTDEHFWDEYWAPTSLPSRLDLDDPATRTLARTVDRLLKAHLGKAEGKSIVEIGCAPGRWLDHFYKLGFGVAGIESAPEAAMLTRENLKLLGVDAVIYKTDAEDLPLEYPALVHSFDCVISLGLIEHFEHPEAIVANHAWLAKPGGLVLIGVPNYAGVSGAFQRRLDKEWLEHHNTAVMDPSVLAELGRNAGLLPLEFRYTGGFDPNLYNWRRRSLLGYVVTRAGKALRSIPRTDSFQSKHLSSYLLATFHAPAPTEA